MTSSGVFPSTSLAMFSISSRPHFSLALMNWLKSRLFQIVNPCDEGTVDQNMHNLEPDTKHLISTCDTLATLFLASGNQYLLQQVLLLLQFLLCESLSFVNLGLFFFLDLRWIWHVWITGNLKRRSQIGLETFLQEILTPTKFGQISHLKKQKHIVPCSLWSFCKTEFLSPEAQKDVEGRTGSLGHLAA